MTPSKVQISFSYNCKINYYELRNRFTVNGYVHLKNVMQAHLEHCTFLIL